MGSELRGVALMIFGIVETWSGRFDDASGTVRGRRARSGDRPAVSGARVSCTSGFRVKEGLARDPRGRAPVRRSRWPRATAWEIGRYSRPHLDGVVAPRSGWANSTRQTLASPRLGSRCAQIDLAAAVLLHAATGMLHALRAASICPPEFAAALRAQSLLTGVLVSRTPDCWMARGHASRLGMPDEAHATLTGFSAEDELVHGIRTARAAICIAEGDPSRALDLLHDVLDEPPPAGLSRVRAR